MDFPVTELTVGAGALAVAVSGWLLDRRRVRKIKEQTQRETEIAVRAEVRNPPTVIAVAPGGGAGTPNEDPRSRIFRETYDQALAVGHIPAKAAWIAQRVLDLTDSGRNREWSWQHAVQEVDLPPGQRPKVSS